MLHGGCPKSLCLSQPSRALQAHSPSTSPGHGAAALHRAVGSPCAFPRWPGGSQLHVDCLPGAPIIHTAEHRYLMEAPKRNTNGFLPTECLLLYSTRLHSLAPSFSDRWG